MKNLTQSEIDSILELIYNEIDKRNGIENISSNLLSTLYKLQKQKNQPTKNEYVDFKEI